MQLGFWTFMLLVGAASLSELFDSILAQYELCLKFFKLEDMGRVLVRGAKDKGDIKNGDALKLAQELGQRIWQNWKSQQCEIPTDAKASTNSKLGILQTESRGCRWGRTDSAMFVAD